MFQTWDVFGVILNKSCKILHVAMAGTRNLNNIDKGNLVSSPLSIYGDEQNRSLTES